MPTAAELERRAEQQRAHVRILTRDEIRAALRRARAGDESGLSSLVDGGLLTPEDAGRIAKAARGRRGLAKVLSTVTLRASRLVPVSGSLERGADEIEVDTAMRLQEDALLRRGGPVANPYEVPVNQPAGGSAPRL